MSLQIGIGLSIQKDPALAVKEATRLASINLFNETADLALVFSTIDLASPKLTKTLRIVLGEKTAIIGCSGAVVICNKGIFKQGLVVMLLSLPKGAYFNQACVKDISAKTPLKAGRELAESLCHGLKNFIRIFTLIFSDGMIDDGSSLIYGIQEKLGKSFPLAGASASDNLHFLKTFLYFNENIFSDGAAGLIWGGKVNFGLGIKHGWKPLGKPRIVTKAAGNIIYEIDDRPAVKIYEEYFALGLTQLQKELKRISVLYPIGIFIPGEEEYLLRNIRSFENNGSLVLQGNVPAGSTIRLMIGTKESCLQATRQAAEEAKKDLLSSMSEFKKEGVKHFVLVFNSVSRYILLRRDAKKELEIIKKVFGENTPIIGLYTYGEQAPLRAISYQGQAYFHNQTITLIPMGA